MLHRSKIFIATDLKIAIGSIGAASNPAPQRGKCIVVVFLPDRPLPFLHCENDRDLDLGVLAMICRSDGADRNFNRGSYKDLAPIEHSLALGNIQTPLLGLRLFLQRFVPIHHSNAPPLHRSVTPLLYAVPTLRAVCSLCREPK